jgi:DNA-binding transcriptional LysR family regulator
MIKLLQLAHALALRDHGGFQRAAKAQHISQPALSRSIQSLEESLGVALFERKTRAVTPTPFGEALLPRAETILAEVQDMQREIALLRGIEAGVFSVAMGAFAAELSGTRAVAELARRHPALRCRSTLRSWRDVAELVRTRSVDLGMADLRALGTVAGLALDPVGAHALVLFCRCGHPLSVREGVSIADLDAFPLACIRVPPVGVGLLPGRSQQDEASGDLIPHIEVDDVATARAIVLASDAFSVATPLQIAPWLASGELWVFPFQPPWLKLDYGFIRLEHRTLSPAAERFVEIALEIESEVALGNRTLLESLFPPADPPPPDAGPSRGISTSG